MTGSDLTTLLVAHSLRSVLYDEGRCVCGYWLDAADNPSPERIRAMHARHVADVLSGVYAITPLPEPEPPSDMYRSWWTLDGGWTIERPNGDSQIRLTFDKDGAMETSTDGEFYPFARLTEGEASDLAAALLASARAQETPQ